MNSSTSATDMAHSFPTFANSALPVVEQAAHAAHRLADEANGWAHQSVDAANRSAELLRARADGWSKSTRSYIEHEPVKATLIAMAAGAVIMLLTGLLTRGRHHSR